MAVFTPVARWQLSELLDDFEIGALVEFAGIGQGSENTNYFVTTTQGEFVFTLFERIALGELPYYLELTTYLASRGVLCAAPLQKRNGKYISEVGGKPAVIVPRLLGASIDAPSSNHCFEVGRKLAELHHIGSSFPSQEKNPFGFDWYRQSWQKLAGKMSVSAYQLLKDEIHHQENLQSGKLPSGLIHADLFVDNVLFKDDKVSGLIDFYYACQDNLLLDIAIAMNDWCCKNGRNMAPVQKKAFLDGYQEIRKLSGKEQDCLTDFLRLAALRFWVSRLLDFHFPRSGHTVKAKDPDEFQLILEQHIGYNS